MGRVFVVEDSGHNYADALRFGEIQILCNEDFSFTSSSAREEVVAKLRKDLKNFDFRTDYLLLLGDPILIGICFLIIFSQAKAIPVLKWDRRKKAYQPLTVLL